MTNFSHKLAEGIAEFSRAVEVLITAEPHFIGTANPPDTSGVYAFLIEGELMYVGEAKGSGGLRDRILRKHVAGDEGHALQRHFKDRFPDRMQRREHIKRNVQVKWVVIENPEAVSVVERMVIWLLNPPLNRT
ncbi:MAG: hypothetical protein N3C59_10120 [Azovibrio sp.]|nr:hypothetical protein [Azovibrio sp.]